MRGGGRVGGKAGPFQQATGQAVGQFGLERSQLGAPDELGSECREARCGLERHARTANVMPAQLVSVYRAVADGELERAESEWARIYPLMDAIMSAPFIPAIKSALNAPGFPAGSPRKLDLDLDPGTAARIASLARASARSYPYHEPDVRRRGGR